VRLGDTHEKILIADTKFAVVTSFNFLSFRADPKRGFRRETGVYYEVKAKVEELTDNVMKRIERVEQASQPATVTRA
jgi:phosphatidylserine/phosphatidylglycerophosphate/cardiolipin synthase-like enzyme